MSSRRIIWQLYPSYLIITIVAVVIMGWYGIKSQKQDLLDYVESVLYDRAVIIAGQISPQMSSGDVKSVGEFCRRVGSVSSTRITVIDTSGVVLVDTDQNPAVMENHGTRPEMVEALNGGRGMSTRFSNTLQMNLMYVAVRVTDNNNILGLVRTSIPVAFVDEEIAQARTRAVLVGLFIAVLAALISYIVSRNISRPLIELKDGARRFSDGDFDRRLAVSNTEEIGGLALAMNQMAGQLSDRINTITRQRGEQEAVLASMTEGVLAFDTNERLINFNKAAATFLELDESRATGLTIQEAIRNSRLQKVIGETLWTKKPIVSTIEFTGAEERWAQASATILKDASGKDMGVLVVLNDITRMRKLENLRRDFVANVSHELKTPITSIMGSVETLLDGAVEHKEEAERFLKVISRQSDRLNNIIEDLLRLSRIESESEQGEITLAKIPLRPVLQAAIADCESLASAKASNLVLNCPDNIQARLNAPLFEQAIINLIDNAIKYSDDGKPVEIEVVGDEISVRIIVKDHGHGIDSRHLPRIFERFYRVDKSRSRELGGTGLGLAIVKHIVLAHAGRITVESIHGQGSTFKIDLPVI